ncbi:hypothetical protein MP228_008205 [Amoeboaphelidium protococcarum]|nr:hypothetical protein MP228_008205 [Amoeboaphelidium protococcarum]
MIKLFSKRNSRDSGIGRSPRSSVDTSADRAAVQSPAPQAVALSQSPQSDVLRVDAAQQPDQLNCYEATAVDKTISAKQKKAAYSGTFKIKTLVSNVREELQCPICLEEFSKPRLLHCGHSFCTGCLKGLYRDQCIRCPTCRSVTKLNPQKQPARAQDNQSYVVNTNLQSSTGQRKSVMESNEPYHPVQELSLNYSILKVMEAVDTINALNVSSQESELSGPSCLSASCVDLDAILPDPDCFQSRDDLLNLRSVSDSKSIQVAPQQNTDLWTSQLLLCKEHKSQEILFYCATCCQLLCSNCLVGDNHDENGCAKNASSHTSHDIMSLQQATKAQVQKAWQIMQDSNAQTESLEIIQADLEKSLLGADAQYMQIKQDLLNIRAKWVNHVDKWFNEQEEKLALLVNLNKAELKDSLDVTNVFAQQLSSASCHLNDILTDLNVNADDSKVNVPHLKRRDATKIWKEVTPLCERLSAWNLKSQEHCSGKKETLSDLHLDGNPETCLSVVDLASVLPPLASVCKKNSSVNVKITAGDEQIELHLVQDVIEKSKLKQKIQNAIGKSASLFTLNVPTDLDRTDFSVKSSAVRSVFQFKENSEIDVI